MRTLIGPSQLCGFHGVDFGEMARDQCPLLPLVATRPKFSAGGAEIKSHRVLSVCGHRLALDRPPCLAVGQTRAQAPPAFAAVARAEGRGLSFRTRARPDRLA